MTVQYVQVHLASEALRPSRLLAGTGVKLKAKREVLVFFPILHRDAATEVQTFPNFPFQSHAHCGLQRSSITRSIAKNKTYKTPPSLDVQPILALGSQPVARASCPHECVYLTKNIWIIIIFFKKNCSHPRCEQ